MKEESKTAIAGDIGGTKTRLGLFAVESGAVRPIHEQSFASGDFGSLDEIVTSFLADRPESCDAGCFGVAGPVTGRRARITNLPWVVDADRLVRDCGVPKVDLINDLEALAWGVSGLQEGGVVTLSPGAAGSAGNGAVIAAGTGLGEAGLYWNGGAMVPFACEGGHASFSPTDAVSDRLLNFLRGRYETVSWERVLSGPGLVDLYRFMLAEAGQTEPQWFVEAERSGDPAPALSAAGLDGSCEVAVRTLELFARLYGEEAGNLALKLMAVGGVWVGGGIAPRILQVLDGGAFMRGFTAKGRMTALLESMPVYVVRDDRTALLGAARRAIFGE